MENTELILNNWRCFGQQRLTWPNNSFLLMDQNGSGKTSLIAAIYGLYSGKPWPGTRFQDSLKQGSEYFGLDFNASELSLVGKISPSGRLVTKHENNLSPETRPKLITYLPTDNYWFNQSRSQRLAVLDQLLGLVFENEYDKQLRYLDQAVRHKTQMIKLAQESIDLFDPILWQTLNDQILQSSLILWRFRAEYLFHLQTLLPNFDQWLNGSWTEQWRVSLEISNGQGLKDKLEFLNLENFESKLISISQSFKSQNEYLKNRELASGKVLFGAQRDEFKIVSRHHEIQEVLSRGEMRLLVLFIKNTINRLLGGRDKLQIQNQSVQILPVPNHKVWWLLDDVFNELDEERERILFQEILSQTDFFVATSTRKSFPEFQTVQLSELKI